MWFGVGTRGVEQPPEARQTYCSLTLLHAAGWASVRFKTLGFFNFFFGWEWQMTKFV